jgi:adenylate cyclase
VKIEKKYASPNMAGHTIKRFWLKLIHTGTTHDLDELEKRYIIISNAEAIILALWLPTLIPPLLLVWPSSKFIILGCVLFPILWQFVLVLNYLKKYLAAKIFLAFSSIICISLTAIQMGLESDNHFFLLIVSMAAFYTNPPKYMNYIILYSLSALLAFIGVELYLHFHGPVLNAPPEFFKISRIVSLLALGALIFILTLYNYRTLHKAQAELQKEHEKSESLLLNILPPAIATRLKDSKSVIADQSKAASILFADVVGFTGLSQTLSAEKLVILLNTLFSEFDNLVNIYKLEKIKTIGDAYMIASGIPEPRPDHCEALALCALDMQTVMQKGIAEELKDLKIRIGIHTGPVIAGVIGKSKFIYDLWGDSVNTASRMESHGEPGKIQVTKDVYEILEEKFTFEDKREILIKGKGIMETYFLVQKKEHSL